MKIAALKAALAAGMCICPPALFVAGVSAQHHRHHRHHDALASVTVTPQVKAPMMVASIPECLPTLNTSEEATQRVDLLTPISTNPWIGTDTGGGGGTTPAHPAPEPSTLSDMGAGALMVFGLIALRRRYV